MNLQGRIGVIGFGVSGRYIVEALIKLGITPIVFEKKKPDKKLEEEIKKIKNVEFVFEYTKEDLKKADLLILSSGVKPDDFHEFRFVSEMDFVCSFLKEYIFITGTKGKGTTLLFTHEIFKKSGIDHFAGGNIGEIKGFHPSAKVIENRDKLAIFEVSSFQLKSTELATPIIHAITNLHIDHLDWHRDIKDYWFSKVKICNRAKISVVSLQAEKIVREMVNPKNIFVVGKDIYIEGRKIVEKEGRKFDFDIDTFSSQFPGNHNLENLLTAFSIFLKYCDIKGISVKKDILDGISFPKREYILQFEGKFTINRKSVEVYNDSLSTDPISLKSAIESFGKEKRSKIILIAGGLAKGFDFSSIENMLKEIKIGILIGKSAKELSKSFRKYMICENLEEAIKTSLELAGDGDIILFSPGCASFDMFNSARERGKIFSETLIKVINSLNK